MLQLNKLEVGYGSQRGGYHQVAGPLTMELQPGNLVCLLGPNGVGKSTLMRTLAGMQPALAGEVLLDGSSVHQLSARDKARKLGVVLTDSGATGLLDVRTVVGLGRYPHTGWSGRLGADDRRLVDWAIDAVGIADLAYRAVSELSDGERQKTMIARALAQESRILILDEITAFLDLPRRVQMMQLLRQIARDSDRAILLSSHDLELALRSADSVWLMSKNKTVSSGAPEDLVLRGDFEEVFVQEGVEFDRSQGSFKMHHDLGIPVLLVGDGDERLWTSRALEREGFTILEQTQASESPVGSQVRLEVLKQDCEVEWVLRLNNDSKHFASIHDLTKALRLLKDKPLV